MEIFEKLGGRKFILAVLTMLILVVLAALKPEAITTEMVAALLGVIGLFNTANVVATVKAPPPQSEAAPEVQTEATPNSLEPEIELLKTQVGQIADIVLRLTSPQQTAKVEPEKVVTNAQANREAIGNYLNQNFGG